MNATRNLSRRGFLKITRATGMAIAGSGVMPGLWAQPAASVCAANRRPGGTLRIAEIGEPLTLDTVATTADLTSDITLPIFEELFALDAHSRIVPLLASSYTVSPDARTYTFMLRRDVPFHNGKEMAAEDVVASLNRWGKVSPRGATVYKSVDAVTAAATDTVVMKLKTPFAPLTAFLAYPNGAAAIMPREIVEATGTGDLKQYVGTGPYRFVEWIPDRHVRLAAFDNYAARTEAPSGYAGRRQALVDEIYFYPVSKISTRIAGVQSGDYDIANGINSDTYVQLKRDSRVVPEIVKPAGNLVTFYFNKKQGVMANKKLRQAVLAALDMEPIMQATFGNRDLYSVGPSYYPRGTPWYTTAGSEAYDTHDIGRAKRLMKEASYEGQPVRWLTTMQYDYMFKSSVVAISQLQRAEFKIDMQVLEWAGVLEHRAKPSDWDVFASGGGFPPDPSMVPFVNSTYPGWWDTPTKNDLFGAFIGESKGSARAQLWAKLQALVYEEVPLIRVGEFSSLVLRSKRVQGFHPSFWLVLWNVAL